MPSKLHHFGLRIPNSIMDKLKYIADYNSRSANKEIERIIIEHISKFELEKGQIDLTGYRVKNRQKKNL
jgi:hypothetical protein